MKTGCLIFMLCLQLMSFAQPAKTAKVEMFCGRPALFVDGSPVTPDFYALTHAYGARWSWEEVPQRNLKNFADIGFRLFQLDLYFEDIWYQGANGLDIEKTQRQVRGLLDVCPDASVVIRVHVNAPFWWNEANRDECVRFANGPVDQRIYGPPFNNEDGDTDRPLRASLASMKWRNEAGDKLTEFCQRMAETPEGKSVIGIHLSGGVYGEWHNWGFIANDPDTSLPMTAYFRQWLGKKYRTDANLQKAWASEKYTLASATVPDSAERNYTADGIFRDPAKERRVIDYYTAQQEVVAEDIEYFSSLVKKNWPRPLIVGVFYGYFHMTFCRQTAGGHLFIERILNCPSLDYLSAPQSYWSSTQNVGGSGSPRGVIESALLHGKLWLDELDNGHLQNKTTVDVVRSTGRYDPKYLSVMQRSAIFPLMRGVGLWYYDFGPRESFGWWDNPVYLKSISEEYHFFDRRKNVPYKSEADVLYVWDQESFYYQKNRWTPLCYNQLDQAYEEALRSGTTSDQIYLFDLDKVNLDQYKAILFMNVYKMTGEQRKFIHDKVAQNGRTLIWNYLPGYTDGIRNSFGFVEELTGFKTNQLITDEKPTVVIKHSSAEYSFDGAVQPMVSISDLTSEVLANLKNGGQVIAARKTFKNYTSVYSTLPIHETAFFREIFRNAGCHIYNDADDFTYANSGLLMIHTKEGGERNIILKNGKSVRLSIPPCSTWLLDGESGSVAMK